MNLLKKFLSMFRSSRTPTYSDLWERLDRPRYLIVLMESGLLGGTARILMFWENSDGHFFDEAAFSASDDGETKLLNRTILSDEKFDTLKSELESLDQSDLQDRLSEIKDGVDYSICWGNPQNVREVSVNNPDEDSKHGRLVLLLKRAVPLQSP